MFIRYGHRGEILKAIRHQFGRLRVDVPAVKEKYIHRKYICTLMGKVHVYCPKMKCCDCFVASERDRLARRRQQQQQQQQQQPRNDRNERRQFGDDRAGREPLLPHAPPAPQDMMRNAMAMQQQQVTTPHFPFPHFSQLYQVYRC